MPSVNSNLSVVFWATVMCKLHVEISTTTCMGIVLLVASQGSVNINFSSVPLSVPCGMPKSCKGLINPDR